MTTATLSQPYREGHPRRVGAVAATLRRPSPRLLLAAVALLHAVLPLVVIGLHHGLGSDETVYLSQFNAHVPAGLFSAPRARGVPVLVAPVTLFTTSVAVLRLYLTVLSGIGLYLGFTPWRRVVDGYTAPLAALLLSTLWMAIYYSYEAMPNEWDAFAIVAAVGLTLRYRQEPSRWQLAGIVVSLAAAGLFRPQDSMWPGIALLVCIAALTATTMAVKLRLGAAVVAGLVAGWLEWVIEAYVSYGGPLARVHAAEQENGGGGLHFALTAQARALAGPLLCRGGCNVSAPFDDRVWWIVLGLFTVVGIVVAAARRQLSIALVPFACGLAALVEYALLVDYAAPRFLLPAYALFALPCAGGVLALLARGPRIVTPLLVAAALVVQLASQAVVIRHDILPKVNHHSAVWHAQAAALRRLGVRPPCDVKGKPDQVVAYVDRCANPPQSAPFAARLVASGHHVAVIRSHRRGAAKWYSQWPVHRIPGYHGSHQWFAWVEPPSGP